MSDLISKQAAIEDVKSWVAVDEREKQLQKDVIEWLKEFPSAQTKSEERMPESNCSEFPNNWIPVDERLPEEDHWLGGSGKQFSDEVLVSIVNCSDEDAWVQVSQTIDGTWALELPRHCKVLAWMPLPEPYKPEEETE